MIFRSLGIAEKEIELLLEGTAEYSGEVFRRIRKIANSEYLLRHACPSARPSVAERTNLAPTSRIFTKSDISVFFKHLARKLKLH
jgi:hypothetical protein